MGGYFSGRVGWRPKCENLLSFDVRRWAREGYLGGSRHFRWQWALYDGSKSNIGVWVLSHSIELDYSKEGEPIRYSVRLDWTPCNLGGRRVWFRCPSINCRRRVAKLYLGSRYFACRRCYNLAYQSQSEDAIGRLWRKQRKLEAKLDRNGHRPKGMHRRTFEVLCDRIAEIEMAKDELFTPYVLRLLGKLNCEVQ